MNAIILSSGKQLDEPKTIEEEEGECVAKEKGETPLVDEAVEVPNDKEQGIHDEELRPRVVEPYGPLVPSPNALPRPSLRPNLENSWKSSRSCKSTSLFWMPSPRCPLMPSSSKKSYSTNGSFRSILWFHLRRSIVQSFKTNSLPGLKNWVIFLYLVRLGMFQLVELCVTLEQA